MNKIKEFVSNMDYLEDKEFYITKDRIIGYGSIEKAMQFSSLSNFDDPLSNLFVTRKYLYGLKHRNIKYINVNEIVIELKYILKIPLDVYEIYVYNEFTPLCIKYFDNFFVIALHCCEEKCEHEIFELKSTLKIKKLSEY